MAIATATSDRERAPPSSSEIRPRRPTESSQQARLKSLIPGTLPPQAKWPIQTSPA